MEDYEKRLCISYLDEVDAFIDSDFYFKAMVSFTALKNIYVATIEKDWQKLRDFYNIPSGLYLHFSAIKQLLTGNPANMDFFNIFKTTTGTLDYKKLYDFYNDLINVIDQNYFVFQVTGIQARKKFQKIIPQVKANSVMYQLFREHLDRMAFHMIDFTVEEYNRSHAELIRQKKFNEAKNLEPMYYFTKLRYDGSYLLSERDDYRNAFSHCIADGTMHFNSTTTKKVFDNLNFIAKKEVGLSKDCTNPCNIDVISHAGAEIVDFAAIYIGRHMWKDTFRNHQITKKGKNQTTVDQKLGIDCYIEIPGYPRIDPMQKLENMIFENPDVTKYKMIVDCPI